MMKWINKLNVVIDWEPFSTDLESLLGDDARDARKGGRPPFDPVFMLKGVVLQRYHGLSDDETEFQILDRFSFMQFLSLQAGDSVPNATQTRIDITDASQVTVNAPLLSVRLLSELRSR